MNDKPIIQITEPEVIEKENEIIYDYDKSHVIYKMQDLGSFAEIQKMKAVNQKYKEAFDKAIALVNDPWSLESGNEKVDEITVRKKKELLDILNG